MKVVKGVLPVAALLAVFALPSYGQLGTMVGRVTDENGERVEGATIMIDRIDIVTHYEVQTNRDGDYRYQGLPVGTYRIALVIDGRERRIETNVRIPFNDTLVKNFDLSASADGGGGELDESVIQEAMNLARNALDAENYDEAIRQFQIVIDNEPDQPIVFSNMATALKGAGRDDEAAENYERAIEMELAMAAEEERDPSPLMMEWLDNVAVMHVNARRFAEGMAAVERMVPINADQAATRFYDIGRVTVAIGANQDIGIQALMRSIELDADRPDAYWQLGLAYFGAEKMGDAIEPLEKYLEVAPDGENADGARALIEAAKEANP